MTENTPLTNKTMERLLSLGKGNGVKETDIKLIRNEESVYKLDGQMNLRPSFTTQSKTQPGRPSKGDVLPSFNALKEAIVQERMTFEKGSGWMKEALKEIEKDEAHGWGIEEGELAWDGQNKVLMATENCSSCQGKGNLPCQHCRTTGYVPCEYCLGTKEEQCPHCQGAGCEGGNWDVVCTMCKGRKFIDCRYCQMTGQMPCPECQGRRNSPCEPCKGTGFITQMAKIKKTAEFSFSLGRTTELPSGLLRMMERIGLDKVGHGHVDVSMTPPPEEPETPEERTRVLLEASIPFSKMTISFFGKEEVVYAFGKLARLSGVPAFLDKALGNARKDLAKAAKDGSNFDKALSPRVMKEAKALLLAGKTHPNYLRQRYPAGLSGTAAQEIMQNIAAALRHKTGKMRAMLSPLAAMPAIALYAGYFFAPDALTFKATLKQEMLMGADLGVLFIGAGIAYILTQGTSKWALRKLYPQAKVTGNQPIGKIGYATLFVVAIAYVVMRFVLSAP